MRLREKILRFMYGRYGFGYGAADKLNYFLIGSYFFPNNSQLCPVAFRCTESGLDRDLYLRLRRNDMAVLPYVFQKHRCASGGKPPFSENME